jgi:hypothetical protein
MERLAALVQRPRLHLIRFLYALAHNAVARSGWCREEPQEPGTGGLAFDARARAELRFQ